MENTQINTATISEINESAQIWCDYADTTKIDGKTYVLTAIHGIDKSTIDKVKEGCTLVSMNQVSGNMSERKNLHCIPIDNGTVFQLIARLQPKRG